MVMRKMTISEAYSGGVYLLKNKRRYLDDMGVDYISDGIRGYSMRSLNRFRKQRKTYGFDERDTWSLDSMMIEMLYERVRMYVDVASEVVNLDFHEFEIDGEVYSQIQAIKLLLEACEKYLLNDDLFPNDEDGKRVWEIWATLSPAMWW